ncbi:MAG: hypothetical protein WC679_12340 [Bacteroidales bacterium]|jgi:hypothetical protein
MTPEEKRLIAEIVWRLNIEVIKTMKQIPKGQLFCWKEKEYLR